MEYFLRRSGTRVRVDSFKPPRGGEGCIYRIVGCSDRVLKVYHDPVPADLEARLEYLLDHPAATVRDRASFPLDIVEDARGQVVGYMQTYFGPPYILLPDALANKNPPAWVTPDELRRIAYEVAFILAELHAANYLFPDLHASQFLVAPGGPTVLIDLGSCQFRIGGTNFLCTHFREEFQPPEILGAADRNAAIEQRDFHSDDYSLAMLLFQITMGCSPFQGIYLGQGPAPNLLERIVQGTFPFHKSCRDFRPPSAAPPYRDVHPDLQDLFYACFVEGHSPQNRSLRPTAAHWADTLRRCPHLRSAPTSAGSAAASQPAQVALPTFDIPARHLLTGALAVFLVTMAFHVGSWFASASLQPTFYGPTDVPRFWPRSYTRGSSPSAEQILERFRREDVRQEP